MRPLLAFLALLLFLNDKSALAANTDDGSDWRKIPLILNEKVAPDWIQIGYGSWTVDSGAIRTSPSGRGIGLLCYRKEKFGNCQIKVVFKTRETNSNSGVYVRIADGILSQTSKPGASYERDPRGKISTASEGRMKASSEREEGPWYAVHRGFEIQIDSEGDELDGTGALYSLAPSSSPNVDTRDWTTMIITLVGERIFVEMNGRRITSFDAAAASFPPRKEWYQPKREPKRPQKGYIGLQTHDPTDIVWYKEISVRQLPAQFPR